MQHTWRICATTDDVDVDKSFEKIPSELKTSCPGKGEKARTIKRELTL